MIRLGRTDVGVANHQALVGLVWHDALGLGLELMGVHWRQIAGFVEGIRTVREEFVKEDPVWAGICQSTAWR